MPRIRNRPAKIIAAYNAAKAIAPSGFGVRRGPVFVLIHRGMDEGEWTSFVIVEIDGEPPVTCREDVFLDGIVDAQDLLADRKARRRAVVGRRA